MSEQNKPEDQDKGRKGKQSTPPGGDKTPQGGGQPTPPGGAKQPEAGSGMKPETKPAPGKGAKAPEKGREAPSGEKAPKGREADEKDSKAAASSEKTSKPAEPRKQNGNGRYSGVNRGLAIAALLFALAAVGGAGYLWQELQKTRGSIEAMQGATGDRIDQLQSARDQLAGRVEAQQGTISQLQQNLQAAQRERQALTQAMRHLRTRLSQDRTEWTLAEVEYLLTVANQSLRLRGSVPTAMAALQAADQQLAEMSDPALIPVRQAIATELQQLRAVPQVDTSGVAARIGGLLANVDELPITGDGHTFNARAGAQAGQAPQPESWTDWRGWLSSIGHQLKGLVTIKEAGEVGRPVMSPEQQYFLRQNLRLKLETARTALLEQQPAVYRDSLSEAAQWVSEYFQTESDTTRAFENTLQELAKVELQPQLPDISASLRTLRKTMDQLQRRSGGSQPATQGGGEAAQ